METGGKTIDVRRIYPLMGVFDGGVAVSKKGTMTVGWEVTWPVVYTCSETDYDAMVDRMASAIGILPPWSIVHRQDVYNYEEYHANPERMSFLGGSYERHFEGRKYLVHRSYVFVTFGNKNLIDKRDRSSGLLGIGGGVEAPSEAEFSVFRTKCREFASVLSSSGIVSLRLLTEEDWLGNEDSVGIVQKYMMLGNDSPVMSDIACSGDSVCVYDKTAMMFVIGDSDDVPAEVSSVSRVDKLSGQFNEVLLSYSAPIGCLLDCEHVVNQVIIVPPQDDLVHSLNMEVNKMIAGYRSSDNRINSGEIQQFLDDKYQMGHLVVYSHTNVLAWGRGEKDCLDVYGKVSSALSSMGISSVYNNFNTPFLWYACIPGCAFEIGNRNWMTAEVKSALCLAPYETFDEGVMDGNLTICDRIRHKPVCVDTQKIAQKKGLIGGFNGMVIGATGTGKSFFTNLYARNCYDRGEAVFIIDIGDSYEGQCKVVFEESGGVDGQYLKWDLEHPFSFNPFVGWQQWLSPNGALDHSKPGVNFLMTILQTLWSPERGWATDSIPVLSKMVEDFVSSLDTKRTTLPTFTEFREYLWKEILPRIEYEPPKSIKLKTGKMRDVTDEERKEDLRKHGYFLKDLLVTRKEFDIKSFLLALTPYVGTGAFSFLLNDEEPADLLSSRFAVFEVKALSDIKDEAFYSVCILCIMDAFDRKMRSDLKVFKTLIIEEAWKALANSTMGPYLAEVYKTARKSNAAAWVVTQQISDVMSSAIVRDTIMENSDIKILLDQSNNQNNFAPIENVMGLTDKDRNLILSINKVSSPYSPKAKEVFISIGGKQSGVYRTEVSSEEAYAFESAKDEKDEMLYSAKLNNSFISAIKKLVGGR